MQEVILHCVSRRYHELQRMVLLMMLLFIEEGTITGDDGRDAEGTNQAAGRQLSLLEIEHHYSLLSCCLIARSISCCFQTALHSNCIDTCTRISSIGGGSIGNLLSRAINDTV